MQASAVDRELLERFERDIKARVPHVMGAGGAVLNPTPLIDLTSELLECARDEYGMNVMGNGIRVFGKFDSKIFGGSVKVRPAVQILESAIASGRLSRNETIFEATSGNFGLALGMVGNLGLDVVALVSRKLQEGVLKQLETDGVNLVNLDVDICPAPGSRVDPNLLMAKVVASTVREQLAALGLESATFDEVRQRAEELLARQDVINLAKLLADAYGGFCPEQYDNELNVKAHETVTGPEIDQQLKRHGGSLGGFDLVCCFGTGGTAAGLSRYVGQRYNRKSVRVVFPLSNQEVGGIRTKGKATGLRFYDPDAYAGEHEVDFEKARRLSDFFNSRGYDIGESGSLALFACLELINYGVGRQFVVFIADGASKYTPRVEVFELRTGRAEVTLQEAVANMPEYERVLWVHNMFVPREAGIDAVASSLGCDAGMIKVAKVRDVQASIAKRELPEDMSRLLAGTNKRMLLVCMAGSCSLHLAKVLRERGIRAESLVGGLTGLPATKGKEPLQFVQIARE